MLFRSDEEIEDWLQRNRLARGAVLSLPRVWELAKRWYADRLSPDFRGRTADDAQAIFRQLGFTGEFWSAEQE